MTALVGLCSSIFTNRHVELARLCSHASNTQNQSFEAAPYMKHESLNILKAENIKLSVKKKNTNSYIILIYKEFVDIISLNILFIINF